MKKIIEVRQEHIDKAIAAYRMDSDVCRFCPVAQAAQEAFNDKTLLVNFETIHDRLGSFEIELPLNARKVTALSSRDWHTVKPFSFEVEYA